MTNPNVGWKFPFAFKEGRVEAVGGSSDGSTTQDLNDAITQNLQQVLLIGQGERPMLGQLGVGADRYTFLPINSLAESLLGRVVFEQFRAWCKRAILLEARSEISPREGKVTYHLSVRHNDPSASPLKFVVRG